MDWIVLDIEGAWKFQVHWKTPHNNKGLSCASDSLQILLSLFEASKGWLGWLGQYKLVGLSRDQNGSKDGYA